MVAKGEDGTLIQREPEAAMTAMKRRDFVRAGGAAAGASALLPFLDLGSTRGRPASGPARRQDGTVRISSNENPLGVPESAREAMGEGFGRGHRYPRSDEPLVEALAERHGVDPSGIVLGNGSTDVLRMATQAGALRADRLRIVMASPTFNDVARYAEPHPNVEVVRVALTEGSHAHDLEAMRRAAEAGPEAALIYVCNPNNPTGTLTPVSAVRRWIEEAPRSHTFLVDEAYHHFVDDAAYGTLDRLASRRPNVIVARTFSKVYAMAGIRVGYAVAHPDTAARLGELAVITCPNHLGNVAATAALEDETFVRRALETNRRSKRIVRDTLDELGLSRLPSHTNFVMHEIGTDVETYNERMLEAGIRVGRPFPPYRRRSRVSLGSPEEMERWAETLRSFRERGWV